MNFLSSQSKLFAGALCLTLVTVEYGGHFLLSILKGTVPDFSAASPQFPFFRAGHAHAGVWVILGLVAQPLIDATQVSDGIKLLMRLPFVASPLLISGGFFAGALTMVEGRPGALHWLIYAGLATLAVALVLLGVNLIRHRGQKLAPVVSFLRCGRARLQPARGSKSHWAQLTGSGMQAGHKNAFDCIKAFSEIDFGSVGLSTTGAQDVPGAIMRAYAITLQPPAGPVYVSIPLDDWDQPALGETVVRPVSSRYALDPDRFAEFVKRIRESNRPALIYGQEIDRSGGGEAGIQFCRTASGARVSGATRRENLVRSEPPSIFRYVADGKGVLSKLLFLAILIAVNSEAQQPGPPELTLDQAVEQALRNNADVRKACLDTRKAAEDLAANRTKRFANIQLLALGSQLLTRPSVTFMQGAFGTFNTIGPIPATDQKITVARRPVGIVFASVIQPLSTQYKLGLQLKALTLALESSREDERSKHLETIDQVHRAYYAIVEAQSQLDSLKASLPLYTESSRLAVENRKTETMLESDLQRADAQLLRIQSSIGDATDQFAAAAEKLNDLMGREIHTPFHVASIKVVLEELETPEELEKRALQNRPDLKKAKLQVRQAEYDRRAKKAEYIPDVSLALSYATTVNFGNALPSNITSAGLYLTWEAWDWGRKRHEIAGKQAQEDQAKIAVESGERAILLEVRNSWRQVAMTRRQLAVSESNQRVLRQKLKEIQDQFKQEAVLAKDMYSTQSDLASADSQYQQALAAFWKARADLKKAIGEE